MNNKKYKNSLKIRNFYFLLLKKRNHKKTNLYIN